MASNRCHRGGEEKTPGSTFDWPVNKSSGPMASYRNHWRGEEKTPVTTFDCQPIIIMALCCTLRGGSKRSAPLFFDW